MQNNHIWIQIYSQLSEYTICCLYYMTLFGEFQGFPNLNALVFKIVAITDVNILLFHFIFTFLNNILWSKKNWENQASFLPSLAFSFKNSSAVWSVVGVLDQES